MALIVSDRLPSPELLSVGPLVDNFSQQLKLSPVLSVPASCHVTLLLTVAATYSDTLVAWNLSSQQPFPCWEGSTLIRYRWKPVADK